MHAPIIKNPMFIPSLTDDAFYIWSKNGIAVINDLYTNNTLISFDELWLKYNIPQSEFFYTYRFMVLFSHV